ncbi:hypothetical protein L249_5547 [Ophiocordyceps polyrhachis-furcata BCC 54312]|uniref:Pyruvate kinase n=1 Tax=Ophiocordyceps polyrhachis-furcata BCC 54312 TaxID=1330021 RepID=A0A367LGI1_9HYPO|nr:hypothetical protein L249_5547 [Ophiocordyceps polyrhachis-furcata BCC 54312]
MNATADALVGPQLPGRFDFTLVFEQAAFSIGPSAILLLASPFRILALVRRKPTFGADSLLWFKLSCIFLLFGLRLAILALWLNFSPVVGTRLTLAAASLSLADVVAMGSLLYAEHRFSYSPSILISLYISVTVLLDVANVRSLFLRRVLFPVAIISTVALALKFLLLALEEVPKKHFSVLFISKETSSGLWNRSALWWLNSTFYKGFTAFLRVDDLPSLDHKLGSRRLASRLNREWRSIDKPGRNSLAYATFKAFQAPFWTAVIPRLCYTGFAFAQPFLIKSIVNFLGTTRPGDPSTVIGGLVTAVALVYLGIAISKCHYMHHTFRLITSVRGGLIALIFAKVVELEAAEDSAAVTLMSTDIDGITGGLQDIHDIWASFIELGLGMFLLERQVGAACLFVLFPAVVSSIATARVARGIGPAKALWNSKVQKRVSTTSSALSQIKGIKMMGLGDRISQLIQSLRVSELDSSKNFRIFSVWMNMIANLADQLTPILVISVAVFWTKGGQNLSVAEAFTSMSIVALVSSPIVNLISAYPTFVASLACFGRIQEFLLLTERDDYRSKISPYCDSLSARGGIGNPEAREAPSRLSDEAEARLAISVENASFSLMDKHDAVLKNVSITIRKSTLTMVVGPVGSGKSALLKAILGEGRLLSGSVRLEPGPVAYCDQVAWLRLGSLRENILGPGRYDEFWYRRVLWACALEEDVAQLEDGDLSLVGSGGLALSGGQKQRVTLARAVYARASIMLLDDVFSSLDRKTALDVFGRLLGADGILRREGTTVLLATHTVAQHLTFADNIVTLDESGTVINQLRADDSNRLNEHRGPSCLELERDKGCFLEFRDEKPAARKDAAQDFPEQVTLRKTGDMSLYRFYLKSVGTLLFSGWLVFAAGFIFSGKAPQIWLRIWTESGTTKHTAAYFGGYLGFGLLSALLSGVCVFYFMIILVPKSAQHLHWLLLSAVVKAPLWIFTTTDLSSILNRFSQDMTLVDQVLPLAAFTTTFDVFNVIAETSLIASGATYVGAVIPLCILAIYVLQKYYLRTSRQMRLLDLEAKTPLYRQFTETSAGIVTVRAFGWKEDVLAEHLQQLDHSQKPYYMMFCIQRWLNVVLDVFVAALAIVLVGFALGFSSAATQGSIGLALLNVVEFSQSLSKLINSWTGLETSLGAIARLKDFLAQTKTEDSEVDKATPPDAWPARGSIDMMGVTAKYNIEDIQSQPAIRDVNLKIDGGQKVVIMGRTGSGKSSLILTLLRMLDLESGRVVIDGVDTSQVSRQALRLRLTVIPQDTVELPGTVRQNLGLYGGSEECGEDGEDEAMRHALSRVGLWETVSRRGGLDGDLGDVGLSTGQKQLFCLARALVSKAKGSVKGGIVLLDEPTSSVDDKTDIGMQRIVDEEFAGFTIVTVSHRPEAAREADMMVHISGGRVAEVTRMNHVEGGGRILLILSFLLVQDRFRLVSPRRCPLVLEVRTFFFRFPSSVKMAQNPNRSRSFSVMAAAQQDHLNGGGRINWLASLDTAYKPERNYRRSSIICTIGPVTNSPDKINSLRDAGLNVVRMNFSHGTHEYHQSVIDAARKAVEEHPGRPVAIALDTKGPEIRTGNTENDVDLPISAGTIMNVTTDEKYAKACDTANMYVDYKNITKVIEPGRIIYVDDGVLAFEVLSIKDDKTIQVKARNNGFISSRKGVNLPNTDVDLPALSEKDKADLQFGVKNKVDMIFASFIRRAQDIRDIRKVLGEEGKDIQIIAKIENRQGLNNFKEILEETDGVMVARGDLGIEIPAAEVFAAQKKLIAMCNLAGKPVICATQMLESMIKNPRPTRAEISDVGNAITDGADCVMLSGETAKGAYPTEAVREMHEACLKAENTIPYVSHFEEMCTLVRRPVSTVESCAMAAVRASLDLGAGGIIVLSTSGESARLLSKYRPVCPIFMVTRNATTSRFGHLYRGVYPFLFPEAKPDFEKVNWQEDVDRRIKWAVDQALKLKTLTIGDMVVVVQGWKGGMGNTNTLRIVRADPEHLGIGQP